MKKYSDAIRFLFGLEVFGMKFGLRGIRRLLASIGNPERDFPTIHVAGTNGKGSTSAMIAAILTASGYKTGLYTSPHLISFTERIRIDGKPVPSREVTRLTSMIHKQVRRQKATFFEAVTAMAFQYFSDHHVDVAVIETGLGGRLDATNVLRPMISVITNVSLEHTAILGSTLEKIAWEKGGIIKQGIPCVTGIRSRGPLGVLRKLALKRHAPLVTASGATVRLRRASLKGMTVDAKVGVTEYKKLVTSLVGRYQVDNIRLVLQAVELLKRQGQFRITEKSVRRGLHDVARLSGINARLSVVQRRPMIIADVAHNPDASRRLVESLTELGVRNVSVVFGVVQDKDYRTILRYLKPVVRSIFLTAADTPRSRPVSDLVHECIMQGITVGGIEPKVSVALLRAITEADRRFPIVVTGSHYVVGEALQALRSREFT